MLLRQQKIFNLRRFLSLFLLPVFFILFSCSDQGCIEADDFGEYETQTLEILSNNALDNCTYDLSKSLTDASQGSGIKTCFTSGSVTIYDENGVSQVSGTGCMGLPSEKFKNLCANQCVANCNANIGVGDPSAAEPAWKSTDQKNGSRNGGVTVKPNALIYIRAVGSIRLGDKLPFPDFFISADDITPQSKTANWVNQNLDVKIGKTINLNFSGKINDNSMMNGGSTPVGQVGSGSSALIDNKVYNAGRRLVAYVMAAPNGWTTDLSQPTEQAQFINIPLLPDGNLWQCTYTGSDLKQAACSNKSYRNNGYVNVDDSLVGSTFPISSDAQTSVLGQYGGIVRFNGDGLEPDERDPFLGITCDFSDCQGEISRVDSTMGRAVGDLSSDVIFSVPVAAKISFRELLSPSNAVCNDNLQVIIRASNDVDLYYFDGSHGGSSIAVGSASWSSTHISVEPNQKIVIRQKISGNYSYNGEVKSCDQALVMKINPYRDIKISQSGFVSFAMLGGSNAAGCNIKARIINPRGQHGEDIRADYYEYARFSQSGADPLENVSVPAITPGSIWYNNSINNGSNQVFVRKGQVIRFSPESWNGTWAAMGGARECGVGMAMRIEPRPALLCRGYGSSDVSNTSCIPKYDTASGALIGCDEIAPECNNSADRNYYCPNQDPRSGCLKPLTCQNGRDGGVPTHTPPIPKNTRYDCVLGSVPAACTIPAGGGATYTMGMCDNCSNLRKSRAEQSPFLAMPGIVKCYDLEAYSGKVANIPITGFNDSDLGNNAIMKGATALSRFNGEYGNFSDLSSSGKVDSSYNNNTIYQVTQPITIARNGRLKFLFLDGTDFYQQSFLGYSDNTAPSNRYTGSNGFKIGLTSALEFANGEWLEAKLCQELPGNIYSCNSIRVPDSANLSSNPFNQPKLVELNNPGGSNFAPISNTPFYFDSAGNIIRTQARGPRDCSGVMVNDNYYCHTDLTTHASKIRLTFKIKDPEQANCSMSNPTSVDAATFDGILMSNSRFRPSDCVVGNPSPDPLTPKNGINVASVGVGVSCVSNAGKAGKVCLATDDNPLAVPPILCDKEYRCVSRYANNSGKYYVNIRVKSPGSNLSSIVNDVVAPVIEVMDGNRDRTKIGQAERIYKLIIADPRYHAILSMSLVLIVSFYGFGFLIGVVDFGTKDFVSKVVKIGLIYLFVSPEGWEWFNKIVVHLFKNGTDYLAFLMASAFDNSTVLQNAIENYDFYDKSILFNSVDKVFGMLFSSTVQKKISALLFASIFGWLYLYIIYCGIFLYIYAVANSVLLYLTSQVFISILFVLAPLFFLFTIFSQTKEMFDKWLSALIGFSMQQIFLLTTLAFFNMMMYEVLRMALGYKVCWDEVWTINIITRITLMSFWTIASLPPRVNSQSDAGNIGNTEGIPSLFTILFIWVIASLMHKFIDFMTGLAQSISGGISAGELGKGIRKMASDATGFIGKRVDEVWDKSGGTVIRKLDQSLFDSGKLAEEARAKQKQQNATDNANKKALISASDKAISDHKKKNGVAFAKLSPEAQVKELEKIRDKAMEDEGKKRGLNKEQVDALKKDKGLKGDNTNIFGFAYALTKQSMSKEGTVFGSLEDRSVNTKFSATEARKAMKNTDAAGRKDFVSAVKKGDVVVGASGVESVKVGAKNLGKNLLKGAANLATLGGYSGVKKIKEKLADKKEYDLAVEQLVGEGAIAKMADGTGWARADSEKEKIKKRVKENLAQKDQGKKEMSSNNTAAKMEQYAESYDAKEESGSSDYTRSDTVGANIIGRQKTMAMVADRGRRAAAVKAERAKLSVDNIKDRLAAARSGADAAEDEYTNLSDEIGAIEGDADYQQKMQEESDQRAVLGNPESSRAQKSDARKKLGDLKSDKTFKGQKDRLSRANAERNRAVTKKDNYKDAEKHYTAELQDTLGVRADEVDTVMADHAASRAGGGAAAGPDASEIEESSA